MWYSPYFGSRNSSIRSWTASDDGRTKQRHLRCRIFSRSTLSNRLHRLSAFSEWEEGGHELDKIYLVAQQGRLRDSCGDDGDLLTKLSDDGGHREAVPMQN